MEGYEYDDIQSYCEYCFEDLENTTYNDHLSYDCTAVVHCQFCHALIYLREMKAHLLNECEQGQFKECEKCSLAFEITEINDHIAQNICKKTFKGWERCQLCEEDVE